MANSPKHHSQTLLESKRQSSPTQVTGRNNHFDNNPRPCLKENWVSSTPNWIPNASTVVLNTRRSSSGAPTPGRHIPRRKSFDFDLAFYKLQKRISSTDSENSIINNLEEDDFDDDVFGNVKPVKPRLEYGKRVEIRRRIACLSEGSTELGIFNFHAPKKPSSNRRFSGSGKDILIPEMTYKRFDRVFPKKADRSVIINNYDDNFFTNTINWWTEKIIIVALNHNVVVCDTYGLKLDILGKLLTDESYASVAVNRIKNHLVCGTSQGNLELWDLETKKQLFRVTHHHEKTTDLVWPIPECRVGTLEWRPNERDILVSACRNGQIDIWDTRIMNKGAIETRKEAHTLGTICTVKHNAYGKLLSSGDSGNHLKVWDVNYMKDPIFNEKAHESSVRAMSWHPTEPYVLMTGGGIDDRCIKLWNVARYKEPILERNVRSQVCAVLFSPLTNEVYSAQYVRGQNIPHTNGIFVWNYPQMKKIGCLMGHTGRVLHLQLSPSLTQLASVGGDFSLRVWKIAKERRESHQRRSSVTLLGSIR